MKTVIATILIIFSLNVFAQNDTTLFFGINGRIVSESVAKKKITVEIKKKKIVQTTFSKSEIGWDESKSEIFKAIETDTYEIISGGFKKNTITRNYIKQAGNLYKFTDVKENKIVRTGYSKTMLPLILQGEVLEFYQNGNKSSVSVYENNELISNKNWLEDGSEYFNNVFYSVDATPFYIPGNNRLHEHILKTLEDNEVDFSRITGNMLVGFIVTKNGKIGGFRIIKGIQSDVNQSVISAFKSLDGEWQPARLNEEIVNYFQLFPINFIHNATKYDNLELDGGILQWSAN